MSRNNSGAHLAPKNKEGAAEHAAPKAKKKLSKGAIAAICVAAVVAVLAAALALFVNGKLSLINYDDGKAATEAASASLDPDSSVTVDTDGLDAWDTPKEATTELADDDGVFNILLLGTDGLELEYVDNARADSIMLMSLNFDDGTAKLTSFERGIGVPITSGDYAGQYDLITHIFARGGADMVMQDIRDCFKVDVDRYVRVNFNSLIKVIDIIGGVDIELTELEAWYLNQMRTNGSIGNYGYIYQGYMRGDGTGEDHEFVEGENHMTGIMALAYARLRAIDSDWHRIERQRTVIQAVTDKLKGSDLATLNTLCNEILPLVQTNLTKMEIAELMLHVTDFLGIKFDQLTIPEEGSYGAMAGISGRSMLAVDFDYNSKLLQNFIYGESN